MQTHQEKKLTDKDLAAFRARFQVLIPEQAAHDGTPFRPADTVRRSDLCMSAGAS